MCSQQFRTRCLAFNSGKSIYLTKILNATVPIDFVDIIRIKSFIDDLRVFRKRSAKPKRPQVKTLMYLIPHFKCQGGGAAKILIHYPKFEILDDPPPLLARYKYNDPPGNHKKFNLTPSPSTHTLTFYTILSKCTILFSYFCS